MLAPNKKTKNSDNNKESIFEGTLKQFKKLNFNRDIGKYLESISTELQLMEEMQIGVYLVDYSSGKYLYLSDYLKDLLGINKDEEIEIGVQSLVNHMHPEDSASLFSILKKVSNTIKLLDEKEKETISFKINYRLKSKEGGFIWVMQMNKIIVSQDLSFPIDFGYIVSVPDNNNFSEVIGYLKSDQNSWVIKHKNKVSHSLIKDLSAREIEVLNLASKGLKSKEIAVMLEISFQTIKIHKKNIIKKLGVSSTLEAIRIYEKK